MLRATFRIAGGMALVVVGLIGIVMPIMPGWIFLIPGLIVLGEYFPPIRRLVEWAKRKAHWGLEKAGVNRPPGGPG